MGLVEGGREGGGSIRLLRRQQAVKVSISESNGTGTD